MGAKYIITDLPDKYILSDLPDKFAFSERGDRYSFVDLDGEQAMRINKNETKKAYISAKDDHKGESVTITSATYEVFDLDGTSIKASASATIVDNSTTTPDVYGEINATGAAFVAGTEYEIIFTVIINGETYQHRKQLIVEDVRF